MRVCMCVCTCIRAHTELVQVARLLCWELWFVAMENQVELHGSALCNLWFTL